MVTIIGGTGRVGSKTADILLKAGKKVRLIARHADKLNEFKAKGAEIFAGDSGDVDFLTQAFSGSSVVLGMLPGNFQSEDIGAYQDKLGIAFIEAIKASGVEKVVFISSVGGHTEHGTGIVAGLARQEVRLHTLDGVDVKILRPTYFMENTMGNIGMIKGMGINGGNINGDMPLAMIATADIAKVAAEYLANPDFTGKSIRSLLGPKDYTMNEATAILAKAIGKEGLPYVKFSAEDAINGMVGMGMSKSVAEAMVGLGEGINQGIFKFEERTSENTTSTTLEEFSSTFAYVYNM